MSTLRKLRLLTLTLALAASTASLAAEPLTIGLILPLSGPFSSYGKQIENGARLYLKEHGPEFAGREVRLIVKDDTGVAPEVTKREAQELVIRDHVDILAGFAQTPGALASASIATAAKKPMVVMNAGTSNLTEKSPYILRTSATVAQYTAPLGTWAVAQGYKKAVTLVADFGPGHDAEHYFSQTYQQAGGKIVDAIRVPMRNQDFSPFLQRVKDDAPDVVFLFLPAGEAPVAFLKGFKEKGLADRNIRILATGDLTNEDTIDALGDAAIGVVTAHHYSEMHASSENEAYLKAYRAAYGERHRPNFMSVAGYDGMHLIEAALRKTQGNSAGDPFIAAAKGLKWMSPRGPVEIDPQTRDIVENIYIRKVERINGTLQNVEIDTIPAVKDPGKQG
ncbi:Branched-chain amino acid transport system substrate-binding protein OS=Castellaniella defragrans OX=75697 GN=HNR28_001882 PE=3 SV=1 [Castellaniella defragrans]